MKTLGAVMVGLARSAAAPRLIVSIWLAVTLFALPGGVVMERSIRTDIESSLIQEELEAGLELGWVGEFRARHGLLGKTLTPARVSGVAGFANLDDWFSARWLTDHRELAAWGILFVVVWILLQGGVFDLLSRSGSRFDLVVFGGASARYFLRFTRIALVAGVGYYGVFRLALWLFPKIERWTRDVTVEKVALIWNISAAVALLLLLGSVHFLANLAKISMVAEGRRSAVVSIWRAIRVVIKHPIQALGLLMSFGILITMLLTAYATLAPSPALVGIWGVILALAFGQIYVMARWCLKIAFIASQFEQFNRWTEMSR